MSIELTTRTIGSTDVYFDNFVEQSIDCDVTLPDYCPDIMRILRCSVQNNITNSKITGDRASADGTAFIRVVYADEKNKVFCYEQEYPFSKYAELSSAYDNAVLSTNVKTEYANCRAVSKRRIDIHGVISIRFRVTSTKSCAIISDAQGDGIQLKKKGIDIADTVAVVSKSFQLAQRESIPESAAPIGKIINVSASPIIAESKIIKGKILLKGDVALKIIYSSDTAENETVTADYSLDFNEIVEAENVNDESCLEIKLSVGQVDVTPKADNDEQFRYLDVSVDVTAEITAYNKQEIRIITDAYSTQKDIEAKYQPMDFMQIKQQAKDTFMCKQSVDLSSLNAQKIYATIAGKPEGKCSFDESKMTVRGIIPVCFVVIDTDGAPAYCEREAEFEYTRSLDADYNNMGCMMNLELCGYACTLTSDSRAEFKAEINISVIMYRTIKERAMVSLSCDENSEEKKKKSSLTIYFCSGDESIWDIARKYNTTVEEIMDENNLSTDYLENKTMLMIPVK